MGDTWGPWPGFVAEFRNRGFWYVLLSPGPDGDVDFGRSTATSPRSKATGTEVFYDPTNGTVSTGDIIRLGPGAGDYVSF